MYPFLNKHIGAANKLIRWTNRMVCSCIEPVYYTACGRYLRQQDINKIPVQLKFASRCVCFVLNSRAGKSSIEHSSSGEHTAVDGTYCWTTLSSIRTQVDQAVLLRKAVHNSPSNAAAHPPRTHTAFIMHLSDWLQRRCNWLIKSFIRLILFN